MRKWYKRAVSDRIKAARRFIRRFAKSPRLALGFLRFQSEIRRRNWAVALGMLPSLAEGAIRARDTRLLKEVSAAAGRLGDHENHARWGLENARLCGDLKATDWHGEDISTATLVVNFMETEKQGLAIGLNLAGFVMEASKSALACLLVVEKRLVPIFQRTLPNVQVLPFPQPSLLNLSAERLVTANSLILRSVLGSSQRRISSLYAPLVADANLTLKLREHYLAGRQVPLIGISWWSSHHGKDLPPLEEWAQFIRDFPAVFVCLQYGSVEQDCKILSEAALGRFVRDPEVDQLKEMDSFASQLRAMDAIITISNTGAHLAGGLGVPTAVIRDDWFRRGWPVLSDETPWYPSIRVFGKEGRPWAGVFAAIRAWLEERGVMSQ
jgi:hypothetical protein